MFRMLVTSFLFVAITIAGGCTKSAPIHPPTAPVQGDSGISVSGECLRKVLQDRGAVLVASTAVHPTPKEASTKVIEAHEKVKAAVKALNLPEYTPETEGYSVEEEREFQNKKWVKKGFRATMATRFETSDIARLGEVIAAASSAGAERVGGLETFVSPEKMKSEREACLETATQNAVAKAARVAAGGGVKVGELLQVAESAGRGGYFGGPQYKAAMPMMEASAVAEDSDSAPAPVVQAKAVDVSVSVTARFAVQR
ncbi:MAG: hypothetical protein RIQ81_1626 [Pseudomonadota bacterium]|jgi:uncharacterized protein YggE